MAKVLKSTVAEINIPNVGLAEFVLENADSVYKDKTAVVCIVLYSCTYDLALLYSLI